MHVPSRLPLFPYHYQLPFTTHPCVKRSAYAPGIIYCILSCIYLLPVFKKQRKMNNEIVTVRHRSMNSSIEITPSQSVSIICDSRNGNL